MIKKLKTWSIVLFFVSMYLPLWTMNILGNKFSLNVTDVNTAILMQILGLVVLGFGLVVIYFRPSLTKIGDIVITVIMALMVALVVIKGSGVGFGSGFFLMILVTAIFGCSAFLPTLAENGYKSVAGVLQKLWDALEKLLKEQEKQVEPQPVIEEYPEPVVEEPVEPEEKE